MITLLSIYKQCIIIDVINQRIIQYYQKNMSNNESENKKTSSLPPK